MKKIAELYCLGVLTLLLLSLAGCGGNESSLSSSNSSATVPLRGVVEDGPIAGAKISLRHSDGTFYPLIDAQGNDNYEIRTDANGAFSLEVNAGINFTNLSVIAVGGIDRDTGIDFNLLEMRSPLGLFPGEMTAIVVSPLTTLIAELHDHQDFSFDEAEDRLCDWLNLPADTNLAARPTLRPDLQVRTLLLSKIALEIKAADKTISPFSTIRTQMIAAETLDAAISNSEVMSILGLEVDAQARIKELQMLLTTVATVEEAVFIYKRAELKDTFAANIEQMLIDSVSFDPQNPNYLANLQFLAEITLQAAGSEVITLGGTIPQRIARYILFNYQLRTWESLTVDPVIFAGNLLPLAKDPWVAEIARNRSIYSIVSPLLLTELPGNDNQQRLAYFYGTDLSPYFQAEQLIGQVFDDAINDAVLLKIIEGKANAGLIDETRAIIATQIVQSEPKAHAYLSLANALIKFNRPQEALDLLDLARDLYRKVIAAKGIASSSATDVANLLATASAYRKAGDLRNAESLLDDIAAIAQALVSDAIIYGKLITGIKNVADAYIADGDLEAAAPLIEKMGYYSGLTPAHLGTYKLRVFNWSETARRYADLGDNAMVLDVFSKIQALRKVEGSAEATYWAPVVALIESLYRVGAKVAALDLANTIPAGTTDQSKAFKLVATYEALQGNLAAAFNIANNTSYFPKIADQIELLTYFSPSRPYVAKMLINAGRFNEAQLALQEAERLLDGMIPGSNLARIRYGYVKVAELYALMGEKAKAAALLQKAQEEMIDDVYLIDVMVEIALGYHNLNLGDNALFILASAQSLAIIDPTKPRVDLVPSPTTPAEAATIIYEKLVKAYEKIGEKSLVHIISLNHLQPWAQEIHTAGTVNDALAVKECDSLLRAALYLDRAGYHNAALNALAAAGESSRQIAVVANRLKKFLNIITAYTAVQEYEMAWALALSLKYTTERNQAIQTLANAYIDRDDFPDTWVASIDSDADGQPDFFNPLASAAEIVRSGLILDDDSDGDGIPDSEDLRPLFDDRSQ
jgi:hypothetical protein